MRKAFVLLNVNMGSEPELESELKKVEGVIGVYQVYGVYDLVVEVGAASDQDLKSIVFSKIRALRNVRSTLTLNTVA
jgi:DNA-binding Lrp family transcriptional regulator